MQIVFVTSSGEEVVATARPGDTVMNVAVAASVPGIDGECGGSMSCATCHVHVAEEWLDRVGKASDGEMDMLGFAQNVSRHSRLSCQIGLDESLDGLRVVVVES